MRICVRVSLRQTIAVSKQKQRSCDEHRNRDLIQNRDPLSPKYLVVGQQNRKRDLLTWVVTQKRIYIRYPMTFPVITEERLFVLEVPSVVFCAVRDLTPGHKPLLSVRYQGCSSDQRIILCSLASGFVSDGRVSHLEGQDLVVVTQHQQEIHKDCAGFWLSRTTVRIIDCRFAAMEHLWPVTLFPFPPAGVTVRLGQSLGVHTSQCLLRFCLSHFTTSTTSPHRTVR